MGPSHPPKSPSSATTRPLHDASAHQEIFTRPLVAEPPSAAPTSTGLTWRGPTSAGPTWRGPTSAGPTWRAPTFARPPSAGPPSAGPISAGLTWRGPTWRRRTSAGPRSTRPRSTGPTSAGRSSTRPTSAGPTSAGPASVGPTWRRPTSAEPPSTRPTSTGPTSAGPDGQRKPSGQLPLRYPFGRSPKKSASGYFVSGAGPNARVGPATPVDIEPASASPVVPGHLTSGVGEIPGLLGHPLSHGLRRHSRQGGHLSL